jgi:UDP-N-acetylmuramoyl-tripeptide--D-alanyl-D-alanine ligase
MKSMRMEAVAAALQGRLSAGAAGGHTPVAGVSTDTRTAKAGDLYVAIRGERLDGHAFLAQAARAGCVAAMVQEGVAIAPDAAAAFPGGLLVVKDTIEAMGLLASHHRDQVAAKVLGVTGSNGKTTVKRMVHHILSRRLRGSCSPKSFNNNIGVPLTLLAVAEKDDYVVCELGSNAPGEIAYLARLVRPDVAVITSLAPAHLEKFGTLEALAAEKASILGPSSPSAAAVVWADSAELAAAVAKYDRPLIRFGAAANADLRLTEYRAADGGAWFEINGAVRGRLPLPGRHNAMNALAATAAAGALGVAVEDAAAALADFVGAEMRLERLRLGGVTLFNDAYNANPGSVLAAADVLAEEPARRRVMIVGDMRELGERSAELHRGAGAQIAARRLDLLIGVGELGRYIAQGAEEAGLPAHSFDSVRSAADGIGKLLRDGDAVLIKGSRAMAMEQLIGPIRSAFPPENRAGS